MCNLLLITGWHRYSYVCKEENEAQKGLVLCSRTHSQWTAGHVLCPNTSDCQTPFRLESRHLLPRICQSPPSSHYLPAEVWKKKKNTIFIIKLACRSQRLNKRMCDQFTAQGLQAASLDVSRPRDGHRWTVGCLTIAVLSLLLIQWIYNVISQGSEMHRASA